MLLSSCQNRNNALSMRCFLSFLTLWIGLTLVLNAGEKTEALMERNKLAIERAAKMYLAFEARHEIGPGTNSDLNLPEKAKFHNVSGESMEWVYPIALGLEIKLGEEQRRLVVLSPELCGDHYLMVTDDLAVMIYSKDEIKQILTAIELRKQKLTRAILEP